MLLFASDRALLDEKTQFKNKSAFEPRQHSQSSTYIITMEVPKDQIATLLDHGIYSSAQMLVIFFFFFSLFLSPFRYPFEISYKNGYFLIFWLKGRWCNPKLLFWTGLFSCFFTRCKCWIQPTPQSWELGLCKFLSLYFYFFIFFNFPIP